MTLARDYSKSQFPYLFSGAKPPYFTRLVRIQCNDMQIPATIYDTAETLNNVRFPPKPVPVQLLSRLCLGKKRKESWTQTWPTFGAKSLVVQEEKRGSSRDAPSQLACIQQRHRFGSSQLRKGPDSLSCNQILTWALWPLELWNLLSIQAFLAFMSEF